MPRDSQEQFDSQDVVIAHVSDPHFGSKKHGDVWELVEQKLLAIEPDLLLVTGDLAHWPSKKLYKDAKAKLETLTAARNVPYYVCAGNHDRHWKGNRLGPFFAFLRQHPIWTFLVVLWLLSAPVLVCVLLQAAWAWWTAGGILGVLAVYSVWEVGNMAYGWWIAGWFDKTFEGHVLGKNPIPVQPLHRPPGRPWTVGLFSTDSSLDGRVLARGYVASPTLEDLRKCTSGTTWDLCIFLVHHHLLSIAALEEKYNNDWKNLLNATCLVNAGRLLEALTDAHVDLVLHGHEHAANTVAYSSVLPGRGALRIVAAGSATGNDSFKGCLQDDATFNVLILSPDGSVQLRCYSRAGGRWKVDHQPLLDAAALRHSRLRRARPHKGAIDSEITKSLTFTQQRDIWVHWVYTNTALKDKPTFVQSVRNSTGVPDNVRVRIFFPETGARELPARRDRDPKDPHAWIIRCDVPAELQKYDQPVDVFLEYRWRDGGLLTREELQGAKSERPLGELRQHGYEFAVARAPDEPNADDLAALELIISLPFEYAPDTDPIVRVNGKLSVKVPELEQQLRVLAPGLFVLRVPYPRKGDDYQVAWKPRDQAAVLHEVKSESSDAAFREAARGRGSALLRTFEKVIQRTALGQPASVALYVKHESQLKLERVALIGSGESIPLELHPPKDAALIGPAGALARAWWGEPGLVTRKELESTEEARVVELLDGEGALICLPVRFSFQTIAPPCWGVVRIALADPRIIEMQGLTEPKNHGRVWEMVFPAAAAMLRAVFAPEENRDL